MTESNSIDQTHGSGDPSIRAKRRPRAGRPEPVRCTARSSRTGEDCKRWATHGAVVCRSHGAAAPQVQRAARRRLEQAADVLVQRLLGLALDGAAPDHVALSAVIAALDRAEISVKTAATVEIAVKPWESVLEGISKVVAGPRDPKRDALAIEAAPTDEDEIAVDALDVEVIDAEADPSLGLEPAGPAKPASGTAAQPGGRSSLSGPLSPVPNPLGMTGPSPNGLMTMEAAVSAAAEMNRQARRREAARIRNARRR
jgi:hypothetical protein